MADDNPLRRAPYFALNDRATQGKQAKTLDYARDKFIKAGSENEPAFSFAPLSTNLLSPFCLFL